MRILSFDTSTNEIHLSLLDKGETVLALRCGGGDSNSSTRQESVAALMPAIDQIVARAGWQKREIELLVVGEGPGGFTGIRTGIVTARTLAQALALPLVAVSKLQSYAWQCEEALGVVLAAGKSNFFAAGYEPQLEASGQRTLKQTVKPSYLTLAELPAALCEHKQWRADEAARAELSQLSAVGAEIGSLPEIANIATNQAQLAWNEISLKLHRVATAGSAQERCASTDKEKPAKDIQNTYTRSILLNDFPYQSVVPLYLRSPSVTVKKKRPPEFLAGEQASR